MRAHPLSHARVRHDKAPDPLPRPVARPDAARPGRAPKPKSRPACASSKPRSTALQKENAELRQTIDQAAPAEVAPANRLKLSDSVTELRLYGEGRLRYFYNQGEAAGLDAGDHGERDRLRYRLRLGADVKLQENWLLGVQVEGNNSARSANVTLGENPFFAKGDPQQERLRLRRRRRIPASR